MDKDRRWLDKLIKKASSMVRRGQDNVETYADLKASTVYTHTQYLAINSTMAK